MRKKERIDIRVKQHPHGTVTIIEYLRLVVEIVSVESSHELRKSPQTEEREIR